MRNQSWHHGITSSLGPICMWLETKFSSAADVIWQTCISDVDWQHFLFFHILNTQGTPQAEGKLGMSGTLRGCAGLERRTIRSPVLPMGAMTPATILGLPQAALHQPTFRNSKHCDIYRVNTHSKQILQIVCRRIKQGDSSFTPPGKIAAACMTASSM